MKNLVITWKDGDISFHIDAKKPERAQMSLCSRMIVRMKEQLPHMAEMGRQ